MNETERAIAHIDKLGEYKNTLHDTDIRNSERFVEQHGNRFRWTPERGWLAWDGKRWKPDTSGSIIKAAKQTARSVFEEISKAPDKSGEDELFRWARKSQQLDRIRAMIELAKPDLYASWLDFDADPLLLTVENGILNLTSGDLSDHDPEYLCSRLSRIQYRDAECPNWFNFLERIQPDPEVRKYLRRAVGYSLTGDTGEQCLFFAYGIGRNGKSVFLETVGALLGEFAVASSMNAFEFKQGAIPNDIARLAGARLVTVSETADGQRINEPLIKDLTGGDTITARFLRREFFEFRPEFKLWIRGNHKPQIRGTDEGIWRRIHLIPFEEYITDAEVDPHLLDKLKNELPGILKWATDGCIEWRRDGLQPPGLVVSATSEYRREMDSLADFIETCTRAGGEVQATPLYQRYKDWAEGSGFRVMNQTTFGLRLAERGIKKDKRGVVKYIGIQLATECPSCAGEGCRRCQ